MIERILEAYRQSQFDFEKHASPGDPLRGHFPLWKPYYRMKWAIARALSPQTILEIGVRYGYSARAFLDAVPNARFVGIDADGNDYGEVTGAIDWARRLLSDFDAELIVADSQMLDRLPGDSYDLVHVDGRQDGDGTFHDLSLALACARFVLLDGYFHTNQNLQAGSSFVREHRNAIDYAVILPSTFGELLIKVAQPSAPAAGFFRAETSEPLKSAYTTDYYLQDCGGFDSFAANGGASVDDPRLRAVFTIALPKRGERVLDLGCGRGEVSCQAARYGADVTGVDYAPAAIELARSCADQEPAVAGRVTFRCEDLAEFTFRGPYDKVLASDLIEHLGSGEVEALYASVAKELAPAGRFVLHTYPNRWFYQYGYAARRRKAARLGCFLPPDPRTPYERLLHINEQSPAALRHQLSRHFAYVDVWFGSPDDPGGSLLRPFGRNDLREAPDLFAVASHSPIDVDAIRNLFVQPALSETDRSRICLAVAEAPKRVHRGDRFCVRAEITNQTSEPISSGGPRGFLLAYHWTAKDGTMRVFDGERTALPAPVPAGMSVSASLSVRAPASAGVYRLEPRLVQERVAWLEGHSNVKPRSFTIEIE